MRRYRTHYKAEDLANMVIKDIAMKYGCKVSFAKGYWLNDMIDDICLSFKDCGIKGGHKKYAKEICKRLSYVREYEEEIACLSELYLEKGREKI